MSTTIPDTPITTKMSITIPDIPITTDPTDTDHANNYNMTSDDDTPTSPDNTTNTDELISTIEDLEEELILERSNNDAARENLDWQQNNHRQEVNLLTKEICLNKHTIYTLITLSLLVYIMVFSTYEVWCTTWKPGRRRWHLR